VELESNITIKLIDIAFGYFNKKIENNEVISINDDIYIVRAIYKQAMFLWGDKKFDDCANIFFMLYKFLDDQSLKNAILSHLVGVMNGMDFETFYESYVDSIRDELNKQEHNNYRYFITDFNENIQQFLNEKLFEIKNIIGSI
jgi:hypothetical protein